MWSLWKEVLLPGTQRDARGREFSFGPADIRAAEANARTMLGRGVPVPCVWEHLDVEAGDPEEHRARYARHTFAHVGGARVNGRGALELRLDGRDPADRDQVLKTRFVSPKVYRSYSDSLGGEYRGTTVAHVAATPTPVQFWQRPFELSQRETLYLSFTPGDAVADDKDKGGEKKGGGESKTGISAVIDALKSVGFAIPDEVCDEQGLVIAIKASGGPKGGDVDLGEPDEQAGGQQPPQGATAGAGGAPMLMSDKRAQAWAKNDRRDLVRRARRLFQTRKIDRPTAERLVRQAEAVQLSYTAAGDPVKSALEIQIEAYEALPKARAWSPDGRRDAAELSDARGVDAPESLTGGTGGTGGAKGVTDFMCEGLPAKK